MLSFSYANAQEKNLEYYLATAKESSPLLKDYMLQQESNKIDSQRLRVTYLPQVNAGSAGYYAPVVKGYGYDGAITNYQTLNALATVSQPIIGKNNLNNQFQAIQLQNLGLENQTKISEQDLKKVSHSNTSLFMAICNKLLLTLICWIF